MISFVVAIGIFGQLLLHDGLMIGAIMFWMQYTAILSFLQFRNKIRHSYNTLTEILFKPHIRFALFFFIATIGLVGTIRGEYWLGRIRLIVWWLFSQNFYRHYSSFRSLNESVTWNIGCHQNPFKLTSFLWLYENHTGP